MTIELTPTYVATIRPDHTIILPEEMPVGATVMVIVVPPQSAVTEEDKARSARFEATLAAIKSAMENPPANLPSNEELSTLVDKARQTPIA